MDTAGNIIILCLYIRYHEILIVQGHLTANPFSKRYDRMIRGCPGIRSQFQFIFGPVLEIEAYPVVIGNVPF